MTRDALPVAVASAGSGVATKDALIVPVEPRRVALGAGVLAAVAMATSTVDPRATWLVHPLMTVVIVAVVLDAYDDLRGRRGARQRVWAVHQVHHAELVERYLTEAGIPCHLSAGHLKTLYAFFGPLTPVDVWVPAEHALGARARLGELFPASVE